MKIYKKFEEFIEKDINDKNLDKNDKDIYQDLEEYQDNPKNKNIKTKKKPIHIPNWKIY